MSGHFSSRLNTVAQGWLQTFLGSNKRSPRDIGLLPRLHWSGKRHQNWSKKLRLGPRTSKCGSSHIWFGRLVWERPSERDGCLKGLGSPADPGRPLTALQSFALIDPPGFGGPQGRSQGRDGKKPPGSGLVLYNATLIRASVGGPQQGAVDGGSRPALPGLHDVLCRSAWQLSSPQLRI